MRRQNRKGAAELFNWVLAAGAILIVIGIFAFVVATLQDTSISCADGFTFNASAENCFEDSNASNTQGLTTTGSIYNNTLGLFDNFTAQLPTVGTLAGVLLILGLLAVVGLGVYTGSRRLKGGGSGGMY